MRSIQEQTERALKDLPDINKLEENKAVGYFTKLSQDGLSSVVASIEKTAVTQMRANGDSQAKIDAEMQAQQAEKEEPTITGAGQLSVVAGRTIQRFCRFVDMVPGLEFLGADFAAAGAYAVGGMLEAHGHNRNGQPERAETVLKAKKKFKTKFWSPLFRVLSGFVGFIVLMLFGTMPTEVFQNFSEFWWVILFWLPGLLSTNEPKATRTYKWYILGMIAYFSAFAIWTTGVPDNHLCSPDSFIQAHSIWHLLSALATYFFFLHFREQKFIE